MACLLSTKTMAKNIYYWYTFFNDYHSNVFMKVKLNKYRTNTSDNDDNIHMTRIIKFVLQFKNSIEYK